MTLLNSSALSREMGVNKPPPLSEGARKAYRIRELPVTAARSVNIKTPRRGAFAKLCTDVRMPERTRKVPSKDSEKVMIARKIVQALSVSRFSATMQECNSAVPASHGIKEAFSTGSQAQ